MSLRTKVYVIGTGGHARSVSNLLYSTDFEFGGFVDPLLEHGNLANNAMSIQDLMKSNRKLKVVMGIGDNFIREQVVQVLRNQATQNGVNLEFPIIVHPGASVARTAHLDSGTVVFFGSQIGAGCFIGNFSVLNHLSSIDHDSHTGDFASLAPGAIVGGNVNIQLRSALMISSSVAHNVTIRNDVILGGNSFLKDNTESLAIYAGNPARKIRGRKLGDRYL